MKRITIFIVCMVAIMPILVTATPESTTPVSVIELRPYNSGGVYITVDSTDFCGTSVFRIDASDAGKDVMYSAALSAFMGNKKIRLEALTSTGCAGWGTRLQSIYLVP